MGEIEILPNVPFLELSIPAWQMGLFIVIVSICMLLERHKVALISTYLFTLYWVYFLYWGEVISSFGSLPNMATLFILCGLFHVMLTLVAFLKEG
jgi:hypothetical protein